ncbi:restriction endonuclease subunit S [Flavobacterium sp. XS2P14]|uniref:restriction endonuclease subunit S n=1 Tax=Flavobacterium sp. XS2P14 TaxID=3401735 RepID=UPI003AB07995
MEKQLPRNWVETDLDNLFNLVYGKGLSVSELLENGYDVYGANGIIGKYDKYIYEKSKVIISCRGAASGVIHKTKPNSYITSNSIVLDEVSDKLLNLDFVKYSMTVADKSDVITGTAQPQITIQLLKYLKIPLPPLAEQNRIVAKLDTLFAQLETIKASMVRIPVLLKDFRQQVLTQAVTGKLTEEWRKGKKLHEWRTELAQDCCEKVQSGGTPKGSNFSLSGIPFLKVYNIVNNKIDFEYKPQYVAQEIQNSQIKKSITYPDDVIMNIVGPPLNKVAIIPNDYPEWNLNQAITLFRVKDYLLNNFLYYFFCEGSSVKSLVNETKGVVGQVNISLSQCREFQIPIPQIEEQQEIVRRVESLFAKAKAIEQQYESLKEKIDNLPQALLHKSFKGELTEQLESDGDARELLEEIKKLKIKPKESNKSKHIIDKTNVTKKNTFANLKKININNFQDSTLGKLLYEQFENREFLFEDIKIPENYSGHNIRDELFRLLDISEKIHNGFRLIMKNNKNKVYFQIKK